MKAEIRLLIFGGAIAAAFTVASARAARDPLPAGVAPTVCADFVNGPVIVENNVVTPRAWHCHDLPGGVIEIETP